MSGERILTDAQVKAAKVAPDKKFLMLADGGGLYLRVDERGRKWVYRYVLAGRSREIGLGAFPAVSLKMARVLRDQHRELVVVGKDPVEERRAKAQAAKAQATREKVPTFGALARRYIKDHGKGWNSTHRLQWEMTTGPYCKTIADRPIDEITSDDVRAILKAVHDHAPETARRLRNRIEIVVEFAREEKAFPDDKRNPATLKLALPKRDLLANPIKHHATLKDDDLLVFMAELRAVETIAARALEFTILTAARAGEVRGATWSEIDLGAKTWTVPSDRMKKRRLHVVPLSDRCIDILTAVAEVRRGDIVFPGRSGPLSDGTLAACLHNLRRAATVHGFRSAFRDWCGRTGVRRELAELSLAHLIGDATEQAYAREILTEERRPVMDAWVRYLGDVPAPSNVVSFAKAVAGPSWPLLG